jgi:hypothetical protein
MEDQKPKVTWSCKGQDFILNRAQDAFVTVQAINSTDCVVQLIVDNPGGDTALESLRAWDKLMSGKAEFLKSNNSFWKMIFECSLGIVEFETKAKEYAAQELVEAYNLWDKLKQDTEENKLTKDDFIMKMKVVCIVINASNFEIFYDVSGFISEHTISVCGDLENGFKTVRFVE